MRHYVTKSIIIWTKTIRDISKLFLLILPLHRILSNTDQRNMKPVFGQFKPSLTTPTSLLMLLRLFWQSSQTTQEQSRQTLQIISFTHPLLVQLCFLFPTRATLELFPSPPPWNIFHYSSKGALSTSPFLSHKRKTRHLWLFNTDSSHPQEQNSGIIKITHNHKLQTIDSLALSRGIRKRVREGRQEKLLLDGGTKTCPQFLALKSHNFSLCFNSEEICISVVVLTLNLTI